MGDTVGSLSAAAGAAQAQKQAEVAAGSLLHKALPPRPAHEADEQRALRLFNRAVQAEGASRDTLLSELAALPLVVPPPQAQRLAM